MDNYVNATGPPHFVRLFILTGHIREQVFHCGLGVSVGVFIFFIYYYYTRRYKI